MTTSAPSSHYSGVNLAATALLEYEVKVRHWHRFVSPFAEWLDALIEDVDLGAELPREVLDRWGRDWTKPEEIIVVDELVEWARNGYVRHAEAIIRLALGISIARRRPDEEHVNSLLGGIMNYRRDTDNAWATLAEAEREAE